MKTIILGLGNPLFSDDSVGIFIARSLQRKLKRANITITEAVAAGLDVLNLVADYDRAIIVDAIQTQGGKAGTIYCFKLDQIDTCDNVTPHDIDFITALELGRKLGLTLPGEITIYAVEASEVNMFKEECTPEVSAAIPLCVDMIVRELGIECRTLESA